jgi:putative heme-binding domain-containing protein
MRQREPAKGRPQWDNEGSAPGWLLAAFLVALAAVPARAQDHTYSCADIEAGVRLYGAQCALCHGPNGDMVNGVDLRRGRFRRAVTDEDLAKVMSGGAPGGMPAFSFSTAETTALIALIRAGFDPTGTAVKVGNIERGRTVYAGKGGCGTCHRVQGIGPRAAPDLSDIGALRTPAALQRSLGDPNRAMLPINRPVHIETVDGKTIKGRRLNEDTYSVQLIDEAERLVSLLKSNIKTMELGKTSPMPSVENTLTPDEVADLVAYLLSLRGVQ